MPQHDMAFDKLFKISSIYLKYPSSTWVQGIPSGQNLLDALYLSLLD